MSHTVTAKVKYQNPGDNRDAAFCRAIVKLGGKVLGKGRHKLYQSPEEGFGFTLPDWRYPLVLKDNGELRFDDYNGSWGNRGHLERLTDLYGIEAAKDAATSLGWVTQEEPNGNLQVFHPSGGMVTIGAGGSVDASGFVGSDCSKATEPLIAAMGGKNLETLKPEYFQEKAEISQQS